MRGSGPLKINNKLLIQLLHPSGETKQPLTRLAQKPARLVSQLAQGHYKPLNRLLLMRDHGHDYPLTIPLT